LKNTLFYGKGQGTRLSGKC